MNKLEEALRILKLLVEPLGGSIEPTLSILSKNDDELTESEAAQLRDLYNTAIDGFFVCAAIDLVFTNVSQIRELYSLEERYPGASLTFMKLARTYWTFKVILIKIISDHSACVNLLGVIDNNFAGVFFPSPGPFQPPKQLREKTMRTLIEQSGANLDVEDYIKGNFYL